MKTRSTIAPQKFNIGERIGNLIEIAFFDEINEIKEQEETLFEYSVYKIKTIFREDLEEVINKSYADWLSLAKEQNYEVVANEVREKRNKLLEESDRDMAFDRLGIHFPDFNFSESLSLTNIVSYMKNLVNAIKTFAEEFSKINSSEIAKYRQELRDITKQSGFPFDVKFPEKPEDK